MSAVVDEEIKRWTARRKSSLVLEIIQGKTTVAESSRQIVTYFTSPFGVTHAPPTHGLTKDVMKPLVVGSG